MTERPSLDINLTGEDLRSFYYLKSELVDFCRKHNLPISGGKIELTERIAHFLDTGEIRSVSKKSKSVRKIDTITEDTIIEANFVCTETHRVFFKERIGKTFSFNVIFQKWLKNNSGKTYKEAIRAYYKILEEKKKGKTTIDKQFEYNTYIRDFFADNTDKSLAQAIECWKHKKSIKGHNRYEESDLVALSNSGLNN
ncbi:hypothetical protein J14TS2_47090 [Bacillus sp. J14TS2]|uniref:DUF6434 domain-containing protein n=1 Tax=Bacillus sp. J14TS2 TaxID=2807188 RepID=UPI001AFE725E|nr:DUF6434 domain-containing protein [Bacillus sp. J14TS2]GIN74234.1 hypothetical protein J14TS2_47090 [Bacillus sp. J14TS2]